jgi:hypothetical protein
MKRIALVLLLAIASTACGLMPTPIPRWEYAIASPADDELQTRLKALGAAGWER